MKIKLEEPEGEHFKRLQANIILGFDQLIH